jgi:hypothetical protein
MNKKSEIKPYKVAIIVQHNGVPEGSVVNVYDDSLKNWYKGVWSSSMGTYHVKIRKKLCDKLPVLEPDTIKKYFAKQPDVIETIKTKIDGMEKALLDIACDVQEELLRNCKKQGLDDCQTDAINENVIGVFNLNREKYIKLFTTP